MVHELSLTESALAIRQGRLKPSELLDRCLERIHAWNPWIQAWVLVDEAGARQTAAFLENEAMRDRFHGPLHGVPVGIKDIIDVEGFPTRAGSPLREDHIALADAPVVAALRRAGAIILGKTVTVEFACFDPSPTRNPWEPEHHTPGGSSSGSAAAVALGMCPGAIGTQTGGSLVRPSTYCGIATCKPTFGLISTEGVVPVSYHLDHVGPMARTVDDLALLLQALLGREKAFSASPPGHPPRLGLVKAFFMERADEAVRGVMDEALGRLRAAGATFDEVRLPFDFEAIRPMHRAIMAAEAAAYHRESFAAHRDAYGSLITELLDEGLAMAAVDYAAALDRQRTFHRQLAPMFEGVDALIMPSTDTTAPATRTTTGTPRFQAPWSCTGVPVISIPCGLASDGMPVAMQLVRRHGEEKALFEVARWCEDQLGFNAAPAMG